MAMAILSSRQEIGYYCARMLTLSSIVVQAEHFYIDSSNAERFFLTLHTCIYRTLL